MARPDTLIGENSFFPGRMAGTPVPVFGLIFWGLSQAAAAASWTVTPALQWQETWSDNVALASPGQERSDMVTQLTPALHVAGQGGRFKANLDAAWQMMNYARGTYGSRSLPTLAANAKLELVDKWLYVDGLASISQQAVSAFGPQLSQTANVNSNSSQTSTYSISPYIHGLVGSDMIYDLRLQESQTNTSATTNTTLGASGTNNRTRTWSGGLRWGNSARLFNVEANFSSTSTNYSSSQNATSGDTGKLYVYFNPDAHLTFFADVGREKNAVAAAANLAGNNNLSGPTRGVGVQWQPGERTSLSLRRDMRYFGPADAFALSHRFRQSAVNISYSTSRTSSQGLLLGGVVSPYYQVLWNMLTAQYPDPVARDLAVQAELKKLNLPTTQVQGFLSDNIMIQRALNISYAITGVRNTLTFMASRSDSKTDTLVSYADFLSAYTSLGQKSLSVNWAFRASPYSTFTASLIQIQSDGVGVSGLATFSKQSSINLLWNTQMTPHASGSLGLRHVMATGSTAGTSTYKENAATATLGYKY